MDQVHGILGLQALQTPSFWVAFLWTHKQKGCSCGVLHCCTRSRLPSMHMPSLWVCLIHAGLGVQFLGQGPL